MSEIAATREEIVITREEYLTLEGCIHRLLHHASDTPHSLAEHLLKKAEKALNDAEERAGYPWLITANGGEP